MEKTKEMYNSFAAKKKIFSNNTEIKKVQSYVYLGQQHHEQNQQKNKKRMESFSEQGIYFRSASNFPDFSRFVPRLFRYQDFVMLYAKTLNPSLHDVPHT